MAAVLTGAYRAIAAAVEQQDRLLALQQIFLQLLCKLHADFPGIAAHKLGTHIHQLYRGQRIAAIAPVHLHQLVAAGFGGIIAFHAGCCRGKQHQCIAVCRAPAGDLVRVVARRGFAAVGVLLFLVHDDQAQIFQRCKHCAACADNDIYTALLDHFPLQQALGMVECRVLHSHPLAEVFLEAQDHLRGKADFRHKHHHGFAAGKHLLDQLKKHQRFSAAGHPVQQRRCAPALLNGGHQCLIGGLLFFGEGDLLRLQRDLAVKVYRFPSFFLPYQRLFQKALQHGSMYARRFQRRFTHGVALQQLQGQLLFWPQPHSLFRRIFSDIPVFGGALHLALQAGRAVFALRHAVLCAIRNDGFHCLIIGAKRPLFQQVYQAQQIRRKARFIRGGIQHRFGARRHLGLLGAFQHHRHTGWFPRPNGTSTRLPGCTASASGSGTR